MPYRLLSLGFFLLIFSLLLFNTSFGNTVDTAILIALSEQRQDALNQIASLLSLLGGTAFVLFFSLLWCLYLAWYKNYSKIRFIGLGLVGSTCLVWLLKFLIARPRPPEIYHLVANYGASFPSAHSCYAAAFVSLIILTTPSLPRTVWAGLMLWVIAMGISRVYLGVHFPSDVLSGWGISFLWIASLYLLSKYFFHPKNKILNKHLN